MQKNGKELVNNDHPQVIEIWNNVFIQFNRLKNGTLESLPARHVDTGMGLERLVRVLQQKTSNYDTDIFSGTIAATEKITGRRYDYSDSKEAVAFRVIADHIRAISFTIADGQLPSNTGAGYVIRRILRRAARYYYSHLRYKQPLLQQLLPVLADQFKIVFPELNQQLDFVRKVVNEEEEAFLRTLDKGLKKMDDIIQDSNRSESPIINGKAAFELFDTYGFPIDLTKLIATENNLSVDEPGFEQEMQQQKQRSRAATTLDTEDWVTFGEHSSSKFLGYDSHEIQTKVSRYRKVKGKGKEAFQVVLDATPFYAESGGQAGDTGSLFFEDEVIQVIDTKKENDVIIHVVERIPANIAAPVTARIDTDRRNKIQLHHSATHLLHSALRKVLGSHVAQKGSLVNDEHLRFDFSHFSKMTDHEIGAVEKLVNEKIRQNVPVIIREMLKDEALQLGAMALFGEKYGDRVRVVIIDPQYSVELCGGTHVGATGELGVFKLTSESAVAAGVRRVEAVCGSAAEEYLDRQLADLREIREALKNPKDVTKAIEDLNTENTSLKKRVESMENRMLVGIRNELLLKDEIINGVTFIGDIVEVSNADALKKLCYDLKNNLNDYVAVLCANIGGKASVAIGISDTVAAARSLDAGKILKEHVASLIKGGGGGQKTLATAGGQDISNLSQVIEKVKSLL
jgi:alanyl-tRNA synthetase